MNLKIRESFFVRVINNLPWVGFWFSITPKSPGGDNKKGYRRFACRYRRKNWKKEQNNRQKREKLAWTSKVQTSFTWRRQRDSNPRGLAPKRFSRPPRYDRFDMPPYVAARLRVYAILRAFLWILYHVTRKKSTIFFALAKNRDGKIKKSSRRPSFQPSNAVYNV